MTTDRFKAIAKGHVEKELNALRIEVINFRNCSETEAWVFVRKILNSAKPGGFCGTCEVPMDPTGTTAEFPNSNTWTCPKCGTVEPLNDGMHRTKEDGAE